MRPVPTYRKGRMLARLSSNLQRSMHMQLTQCDAPTDVPSLRFNVGMQMSQMNCMQTVTQFVSFFAIRSG